MIEHFKPQTFGRFMLTERIAVGGMAEIFNAKVFGAMGFEKNLVIKRILPQFAGDGDFLRMFVTEAKLVCNLEHPNIVQVHELGEHDGLFYIAMEYVNGLDARVLWRTLARRGQRLPMPLALYIVSEFLKGLDYAHRAVGPDGQLLGVVHRDVSLSNVMISYLGGVKIGDFGIALVKQESKSQSGALKGKYGYMTPEHLAGHAVDHRSDVFASGIVLAELLMGRRLFRGANDFETMRNVINVRLDVFEEHQSHFPAQVVEVVHRALERDPGQRYQSAGDLQDAVATILHQLASRITAKTLAAFISGHVAPYLEARSLDLGFSEETDSGAEPPQPEVIALEALGSGELTPSASEHADPGRQAPPDGLLQRARHQIEQDLLLHGESFGAGAAPEDQDDGWSDRTTQDDLEPVVVESRSPLRPDDITGRDPERGRAAPDTLEEVPGEAFGRRSVSIFLPGEADLDPDEAELDEAAFDPALRLAADPVEEAELETSAPRRRSITRPESSAILTSGTLEQVGAEPEEEPTFHGTLDTRTVSKVLFRFAVAEETGLLVLTGPVNRGRQAELIATVRRLQAEAGVARGGGEEEQVTCQILLQDGQPQLVAADRSEEALAAYLLRVGVIQEARLAAVIRTHPDLKPVSALLKAGQLAPLQVSRQVASFVQWLVFNVFTWTEGEFAFYRDRPCTVDAFPAGKTTLELIGKGIGLIKEEALDAHFEGLIGYYLTVNRTPPVRIEQIEPDPLMLAIYRELGTPRHVEDAVQACLHLGPALRVKQVIYFLIECELAELE